MDDNCRTYKSSTEKTLNLRPCFPHINTHTQTSSCCLYCCRASPSLHTYKYSSIASPNLDLAMGWHLAGNIQIVPILYLLRGKEFTIHMADCSYPLLVHARACICLCASRIRLPSPVATLRRWVLLFATVSGSSSTLPHKTIFTSVTSFLTHSSRRFALSMVCSQPSFVHNTYIIISLVVSSARPRPHQ